MRSVITVLCLFFSGTSLGSNYIDESIVKAANKVGVPSSLLKAICSAESSLKQDEFVYADGGDSNHAFGLCQVLLKTAEGFGFSDDGCKDNYKFRKEDRKYKNCKLFGPYTNALYAAKYLKFQLDRYGNSWINAVAAYNTGTVRLCKTGWVKNIRGEKLYTCEKGGILNQKYVDRVLKSLIDEGEYVSDKPSRIQKKEKTIAGSGEGAPTFGFPLNGEDNWDIEN